MNGREPKRLRCGRCGDDLTSAKQPCSTCDPTQEASDAEAMQQMLDALVEKFGGRR